jgi:hypothetical protein
MPLTTGHYAPINPDWILNGKPVEPFRTNIRRQEITTDVAAALTTQIMTGAAMHLRVGDVVTKIGFLVGATAAGTPTNSWVALYSSAATPALMAQSADQAAGAIAANALYELSLATPQTITVEGFYVCALMSKATTVPSLQCHVSPLASANGAVITGMAPLAATSGSALVATAPATWAAPTTVVNIPYVTVR